jgi:DNA (cytosine-5)-methyltransferase 1
MRGDMKYFSMFTGVGGFELGIGDKGECVGFSEIDKYCNELLQIKFPNIKNYGDATKIDERQLPDFDLLVGGFPCQSFSISGRRRGIEDTRGTLFYDIARILRSCRTSYFILENVKGLTNHDNGRTFRIIIWEFSRLGYDIQWQIINSKNFGVPQNRERVFIIGHLRGKPRPKVFPIFGDNKIHLEEITQGVSDAQRIYNPNKIAKTLKALGGGLGAKTGLYQMSDNRVRRLTPLECERLQGFPDNWTEGFSDTQRYKMMGNAVTVNVIEYLINTMKGGEIL